MSQAYQAEKKYKDAAKILESLLKTHPENLQAYKELADIYITDKSFKKAVSLLKRAEILEASDVEINFQLGYAYMQRKKYQEAAEEFRKVLEMNPDHKDAQKFLDQCLEKIKK